MVDISVDSSIKTENLYSFSFETSYFWNVASITLFTKAEHFVLFSVTTFATALSEKLLFMIDVRWLTALNDILCSAKKEASCISALCVLSLT